MDVRHATTIARQKGMAFGYKPDEKLYVLSDRSGTLMIYAPITVHMMTEARWRNETNLYKTRR